ncbi:exodeoxyribonuclease 7 small subunit [Carboxydothermus islandicus]|uniref:Exodeoxyribonuclease 7 small subunit n=1 Tax=Carboxydothermus islandicus TaxID=661089 RepID=A0A1L8D3H6_9THEO|nr:exodeoxyribonuclease VII small subunit [Carboxydothermus islandicus]GAV25654.1 exodeoxyribonuclease 7 small subunit [Carboxydothermus islandicus]
MTFEEAMNRLNEIVERLERGNVGLEESLALFEEGLKLHRFCSEKLKELELKLVEVQEDEAGEITLEEIVEMEDDLPF